MSIASQFGEGVGKVLLPVLNTRLDAIQKDVMLEVRTFLADARKDIPVIGGEIAAATVQAVFDHTQIDETADQAMNVLGGILGRLGIRR